MFVEAFQLMTMSWNPTVKSLAAATKEGPAFGKAVRPPVFPRYAV